VRPTIRSCFAALVLLSGSTSFSQAGETEASFLTGYIGNWTGRGELRGNTTETMACRLDVEQDGDQQIGFDGRCVIAGESFPLEGIIRYSDENTRYEASGRRMGSVVGEARNGGVAFTLGDDYSYQGRDGTFRVRFVLAQGSITIDFAVADRTEGSMLASIPLSQ
jgi:hypothetical protein